MGKICKACSYERTDLDDAPDYACPNCGKVYAKVEQQINRQKEKEEELKIKHQNEMKEMEEKQKKEEARQEKREEKKLRKMAVCTACEDLINPRKHTPGSIWISIILLCFFIIPGVIYEIWRMTSKYKICPKCKQRTVVPTTSSKAQKILKQQGDSV